MVITITSLRLRKLWHFFVMSYRALFIVRQIKMQKGFIQMKNTGFGYLHFTLSVWKSEEDMKNFAKSGKHREAMQSSRSIATEIRTYTFHSENIPDWNEAKKLVLEKGKIISFD